MRAGTSTQWCPGGGGNPKLEVLISVWKEERGRSYPAFSAPSFSMSSHTYLLQQNFVNKPRLSDHLESPSHLFGEPNLPPATSPEKALCFRTPLVSQYQVVRVIIFIQLMLFRLSRYIYIF